MVAEDDEGIFMEYLGTKDEITMNMDEYRKQSEEFQKYLDENLPKVSLPTEKTYRVVYRETLVHVFYVEASNEDEAKEVFEQDMMDGKVDFSDGEVEDAKYEIKEDK
jgi:hypothetical protein